MKLNLLEKKLGKKIKRNAKILGIDTASRTGWCLLTTDNDMLYKDYGFVKIDTKNRYFKYNEIISIFSNIIKPEYTVIVEDTFYRFNPKMFRLISRIGAVAYTLAHLRGCEVSYLMATSARKGLGFKGNAKKADIHIAYKKLLDSNIKDEDIIDAEVLAMNGLIIPETEGSLI